MSMLDIQALTKCYGSVTAIDDLCLSATAGSKTAVVGPSGSGKTTLLRLIAGFDMPDAGQIRLGGSQLAGSGTMVPPHKRGIGLVSQDGALFPHLSIAENIGFGLERDGGKRDARIRDLAAMVELDPALLARRPHQISGGQQQRVALARALACQPRLMLLDEPFSALDTGLRDSLRKTVSDVLGAAGITTILVTHDQTEAMSFADQLAVLRDGRLVQAGPPRQLYEQPADRQTALFLGDAILLPATIVGAIAQCALGALPVGLGEVAAASACASARTEIMLRPEQITAQRDPSKGSVAARVLHVEFSGPTGVVTVSLAADHGTAPLQLSLRLSRLMLPEPGDLVHLTTMGTVHPLR